MVDDEMRNDETMNDEMANDAQLFSHETQPDMYNADREIDFDTVSRLGLTATQSESFPLRERSVSPFALSSSSVTQVSVGPLPKAVSTRHPSVLSRFWWWDIFGSVISLVCLVLLFAFLTSIDNTRVAQWRWTVLPNALVSFLATIARSALLLPVAECLGQLKWIYFKDRPSKLIELQRFDDASRGPWGSLVFLW